MKEDIQRCRYCGKKIAIICWGIYRKSVIDPEAVAIIPDEKGEDFIRIDGSKVRGREAEMGTIQAEYAYRLHGKTCRQREPS